MKFPFVSRERLEDVQRQLAESEAERKHLLERLLNGPPKTELEQVKAPEPSKESSDGNIVAFTTPFDRLEKRMSAAIKTGGISKQFRAKAVR